MQKHFERSNSASCRRNYEQLLDNHQKYNQIKKANENLRKILGIQNGGQILPKADKMFPAKSLKKTKTHTILKQLDQLQSENDKIVQEFRAISGKPIGINSGRASSAKFSNRKNSAHEKFQNLGDGLQKLKFQKNETPKKFDLFDLDTIEDEVKEQQKPKKRNFPKMPPKIKLTGESQVPPFIQKYQKRTKIEPQKFGRARSLQNLHKLKQIMTPKSNLMTDQIPKFKILKTNLLVKEPQQKLKLYKKIQKIGHLEQFTTKIVAQKMTNNQIFKENHKIIKNIGNSNQPNTRNQPNGIPISNSYKAFKQQQPLFTKIIDPAKVKSYNFTPESIENHTNFNLSKIEYAENQTQSDFVNVNIRKDQIKQSHFKHQQFQDDVSIMQELETLRQL